MTGNDLIHPDSVSIALFLALPRKLRWFAFSIRENGALTIVACAENGIRREIRNGEVTICV